MALQEIFNAITPDNIKNIPLIRDAMEIFIKNLEEVSVLSVDINKITSHDNYKKQYGNEIFKDSAVELRSNLLKMYLNALYHILSEVQTNKIIQNKIELSKQPIVPLKGDITETLNDEYLISNKEFKQRVGTKLGLEYAYNLAKYLENNETTVKTFKLEEIQPFHYKTEGTIFKETYENIVKPLSHPIGFTYTYFQALTQSIVDLFGLVTEYNVQKIEVRCLSGHIDVFTKDSDDTNVKADFLNRINDATSKLYTEQEYNESITVYTNKIVETFTNNYINDNPHRSILFTDGTYLDLTTNPIQVYYRYYVDELAKNDTYIKYYTEHCSLYVEYTEALRINYTDDIEKFVTTFFVDDLFLLTDIANVTDDLLTYFRATNGHYLYSTLDNKYFYTPLFDNEEPFIEETPAGPILVTGYYLITLPDETEV